MSRWASDRLLGSSVLSPSTDSAHSLNLGIFCPENWYLLPEMLTTPSSPNENSVSLKPHPLCLNHCYLFLMDYPLLMFSDLSCWAKLCSLSINKILINSNLSSQTILIKHFNLWTHIRMNGSRLIQSLRNINEIMHNLMKSNKFLFFKGKKILKLPKQ